MGNTESPYGACNIENDELFATWVELVNNGNSPEHAYNLVTDEPIPTEYCDTFEEEEHKISFEQVDHARLYWYTQGRMNYLIPAFVHRSNTIRQPTLVERYRFSRLDDITISHYNKARGVNKSSFLWRNKNQINIATTTTNVETGEQIITAVTAINGSGLSRFLPTFEIRQYNLQTRDLEIMVELDFPIIVDFWPSYIMSGIFNSDIVEKKGGHHNTVEDVINATLII